MTKTNKMAFNNYLNRDEFLEKVVQGKKVLHLGCVGSTLSSFEERIDFATQSLHYKLSNVANVIGIDYSEDIIAEYKKLGIFDNIKVGNVEKLEKLNITDKFDFIIAGDIIEHLSNPGLMLEGIKKFCKDNTEIIITTPHAFGLANFLRFTLGKYKDGPDHVITFNVDNIQNLLKRHGYSIIETNTCFQSLSVKQYPNFFFKISKNMLAKFPKFGGTLIISAKFLDNI